jgi:hypothetical protein
MPAKPGDSMEFTTEEPFADPEVTDFMEEEIHRAPKAPREVVERLRQHTSSSPDDSGGDVDADWADVNNTGSESVGGHNPTPDQSDSEANAHALGVDFQDNEPLDLLEKMEKRDRNRWELEESSKEKGDMI